MSDAFVPEADRLEQERDWGDPDEEGPAPAPEIPLGAPEADVIEQSREVGEEDWANRE